MIFSYFPFSACRLSSEVPSFSSVIGSLYFAPANHLPSPFLDHSTWRFISLLDVFKEPIFAFFFIACLFSILLASGFLFIIFFLLPILLASQNQTSGNCS